MSNTTTKVPTFRVAFACAAPVVAGLVMTGCSFGDAPKGLSPTETQAAVAALPPLQQIDFIRRSPLPEQEKVRRISQIKAANGIK